MTTKSYKVLVVDDNIINQKVAVKMLERSNIITDIAANGREAIDAFKNLLYDLILMDIQMPEMDGLEATRTIRTIEQNKKRTTIIALTANAMQGDRERCLKAGMDDYLSKPIKQQDIDMMIERWLTSKTTRELVEIQSTESLKNEMIDPKRIEQIKEIGDNALLHELLSLYLQDLKQFSADIQTALEKNNFKQIYEYSHKLKGSSANLGIESIRQACIGMEQYAKENDLEKARKHFTAMEGMIERIRTYILQTFPAN